MSHPDVTSHAWFSALADGFCVDQSAAPLPQPGPGRPGEVLWHASAQAWTINRGSDHYRDVYKDGGHDALAQALRADGWRMPEPKMPAKDAP